MNEDMYIDLTNLEKIRIMSYIIRKLNPDKDLNDDRIKIAKILQDQEERISKKLNIW